MTTTTYVYKRKQVQMACTVPFIFDGNKDPECNAATHLDVHGCKDIEILNMPNLNRLNISGNNDGTKLVSVANVPNLAHIVLSHCELADNALEGCRDSLTMLKMENVKNTYSITDLPSLRSLDLMCCGVMPNESAHLTVSGLDALILLFVHDCGYETISIKDLQSVVYINYVYRNTTRKQNVMVEGCPNLVRGPTRPPPDPQPELDEEVRKAIRSNANLKLLPCKSADDFAVVAGYMLREIEYGNSAYFCKELRRLMCIVLSGRDEYDENNTCVMYLMYVPDIRAGPLMRLPMETNGTDRIVPFFISTKKGWYEDVTGLDGKPRQDKNENGYTELLMVTDTWVSASLVRCSVAQRAVLVLKPWLVNGILPSGRAFWDRLGITDEKGFKYKPVPPKYLQALHKPVGVVVEPPRKFKF